MKKLISTAFAMMLAVPASADFGAIYYDASNGAWGYSERYSSQAGAANAAFNYCAQNGRECQQAIWFENACGALAKASNGAWGADWGNSYLDAESKALRTCRSYANMTCGIVTSVCSND